MVKKKKDRIFILEAQIISVLRRLFVRSPHFQATKNSHQRPYVAKKKDGSDSTAHRVQRQCNNCKNWYSEKGYHILKSGKKKKVTLIACDHVEPVINPDGTTRNSDGSMDWNKFVARMWIDTPVWDDKKNSFEKDLKGKLQLLCRTCHDDKTKLENNQRVTKRKKVLTDNNKQRKKKTVKKESKNV